MTGKKLLLILTMLTASLASRAVNDTIIIRDDESVLRVESNLDSLLNNWFVRMSVPKISDASYDSTMVEYSDSIYKDRISRINSVITLPYNNIIKNHIEVYTAKKRDKFRIMLGLSDYYFPMIEDVFDSYGLPTELKYMAAIESALNPTIVSRAGATGLWQFMYSTGKLYGLTINSVVDERRDPVKATHAAARYLKDLYGIYNDWILVIAAYNCGPGNVNKAIKRSGNRKDYWEIYYHLPRETRGYIPQYVAAVYAMNYYKEHGIVPVNINMPVAVDTVMVNKDFHLLQISAVLNLPIDELRAINPQYKTGFVPGKSKPMAITLPINSLGDFIDKADTITGFKKDFYLTTVRTTDPTKSTFQPPDVSGKTKLLYTVKENDNLGFISSWYNVGVSDLRYWNDLYHNTIRVGQRLSIFVDPSKAERYSKVNDMTFEEKQQMIGKPVTAEASAAPQTIPGAPSPAADDSSYEVYTVRYGDNVWNIAKKYDGVTATEILKLNSISDPSKIKIGQKLKIKKKI
jgi:membrane-bound lytic murein transglycosylase D